LLRPPYLFLILLQSSVFGLITTPLFLVLLRDPVLYRYIKWADDETCSYSMIMNELLETLVITTG
jgi:hypothetical protein